MATDASEPFRVFMTPFRITKIKKYCLNAKLKRFSPMGNFVGVEFYDIYMKNSWKNNKHLKFRPDTYRADLFHPKNSTISPFSSMPNF